MSEHDQLVAKLAAVHPDDLKKAVKAASLLRLDAARAAIPPGEVQTIRELWQRKRRGQTFVQELTLRLRLALNVNSDHEYGRIASWHFTLQGGTDEERALWDLLDAASFHDTDAFWKIVPEALPAAEEESALHARFEQALYAIKEKYGVDAYLLLDEDAAACL